MATTRSGTTSAVISTDARNFAVCWPTRAWSSVQKKIGNSLRSDILPVLDDGGWAVHVPAALSWSHEHADVPPSATGRYFEVAALERLPDVVEKLARRSLSPRSGAAVGRRRPASGSRRS